jgi:hypothetical protein
MIETTANDRGQRWPFRDLRGIRKARLAWSKLRVMTLQAEVCGVVAEKYAEPSRAVLSDSATGDDAVQRYRLSMTTLQIEQPGTVAASNNTRQVAYLQPLHPDRYRISVVRIVILGDQQRIDVLAYPFITVVRSYQAPQIFLVMRLTDNVQVVVSV